MPIVKSNPIYKNSIYHQLPLTTPIVQAIDAQFTKSSRLPLIPSQISCTEIKLHPSNSSILEGGKLRQCGEGVAQGFHTRVLPMGEMAQMLLAYRPML